VTGNFTICVSSSRIEIYYKSKSTAIDMKIRSCALALQYISHRRRIGTGQSWLKGRSRFPGDRDRILAPVKMCLLPQHDK